MFIIRRVNAKDLDNLEKLAMSYTMGVTSLPKNRYKLEEKLKLSLVSFDKAVSEPSHELYLFLLEDTVTGEVGGISGIMARCGTYEPVHLFRVQNVRSNKGVELPAIQVLHPISLHFGPSEICSLFLLKEFRRGGLGKLLSLSRFLFMASHPQRFDTVTIAEMRGVIKTDNSSPFWDSVGRYFVNMTFQGAMALRDKGLFHYYNLIPEFPIYISMLTKKARDCIGKVHQNTKPALKMLLQQGFHVTSDIDVFDGGPVIQAATADIKTIRRSKKTVIAKIEETMEQGRTTIISTVTTDFRACFSSVKKLPNGKLVIPAETAKALNLEVGSVVRYITITKG